MNFDSFGLVPLLRDLSILRNTGQNLANRPRLAGGNADSASTPAVHDSLDGEGQYLYLQFADLPNPF